MTAPAPSLDRLIPECLRRLPTITLHGGSLPDSRADWQALRTELRVAHARLVGLDGPGAPVRPPAMHAVGREGTLPAAGCM